MDNLGQEETISAMDMFDSPEDSPALAALGVDAEKQEDPMEEFNRLLKENGALDENGNDITPQGLAKKEELKQIAATKAQAHLDNTRPYNNLPKMITDNPLYQATGGVADAIQSAANLGLELADEVTNLIPGMENVLKEDTRINIAERMYPKSPLIANNLIRGGIQFLLPFGYMSKGLGAVAKGASAYKKAAAAGAAADFIFREGDSGNMSDFVQTFPSLANPISEYLAIEKR